MSWQTAKLGEVCDVRDGTHDSPKYTETGFPLITSKNLVNGYIDTSNSNYIGETDYINISKRSKVDCGDILMPMIGTIGNPVVVDEPSPEFAIKNVALIKFTDTSPDRNFVKSVLQSQLFSTYVDNASRGGTQKFLSLGDIRKFSIPLPPLPEQKRIAAILDKADELKRKREAAIAKLDQLAQSIFVEMFGDVESNEKQLPIKNLKYVCLRVTDGTHQAPKWVNEGIPFLFISNIVNGEILLATNKYISGETYYELTKHCPIEIGDVLYTTVGSYGNVAIVKTTEKFCFQRHIAHIKPNHNLVKAAFLSAMLFSKSVRQQVDRVAKGVAQKTVNLSDLTNYMGILPSFSFTRRIRQSNQQARKVKS